MKNPTSLLSQLSEAFAFSAFLSLALPLAFPVVAWIDGAGDAYFGWAIFAFALSVFVAGALMSACMALSSLCDSIEQSIFEREQDARAFHAYLMDGGRA